MITFLFIFVIIFFRSCWMQTNEKMEDQIMKFDLCVSYCISLMYLVFHLRNFFLALNLGLNSRAAGSAYLELGQTKVFCTM